MRLTKEALKQIIKEELEVVLTNEEAGEIFGDEVKEQLDEDDFSIAAADVSGGEPDAIGSLIQDLRNARGAQEVLEVAEQMEDIEADFQNWHERLWPAVQDKMKELKGAARELGRTYMENAPEPPAGFETGEPKEV
jgi:hypothetical protein